jgi:hypothetical protein
LRVGHGLLALAVGVVTILLAVLLWPRPSIAGFVDRTYGPRISVEGGPADTVSIYQSPASPEQIADQITRYRRPYRRVDEPGVILFLYRGSARNHIVAMQGSAEGTRIEVMSDRVGMNRYYGIVGRHWGNLYRDGSLGGPDYRGGGPRGGK